ncbi:hypothetical protein COT94_00655 [Candidatus Falkowbacteria bacterium CG10_big_fil_rev_8_21_14_0_10_37_14]|uniref:Type II secretion system protein J n=1 Tax=Candidatus Falkowbacteria bacterium CG10_big_fil_rev_8_21_14_0_10_37_14 TaxID=1974561 RepID=A0A2M6WUI9_9BACT|nr:prepilin-type N-terminal cleavage/methylation domain-containing protein [Candidatus Falkowbacteria bacterium]PIT96458.1 MAG: hypothetical protein COT94_00655 [Candidatus Falkowbacteria bacterium CG10_big_fil_rev_8_21_14_0_10_37_14]
MTPIKNHHQALTLIELIVAVSLFAILALAITRVFLRVMDVQDKITNQQNLEGDLRYALGVLTDETKKSKKFIAAECSAYCSCSSDTYFCVNSVAPGIKNKLCVLDNKDVCVQYYVTNGRLIAQRLASVYTITSADIFINKIYFDTLTSNSSTVAIRLSATSTKNANESVYYQTAITNTPLQ